jgi:hypothetical protein
LGWNLASLCTDPEASLDGHASVLSVARQAQTHHIKRLVFAHIGRPTIRAMDAGLRPVFGEFGEEGKTYRLLDQRRSGEGRTHPSQLPR